MKALPIWFYQPKPVAYHGQLRQLWWISIVEVSDKDMDTVHVGVLIPAYCAGVAASDRLKLQW
jgi:hypothetical protein